MALLVTFCRLQYVLYTHKPTLMVGLTSMTFSLVGWYLTDPSSSPVRVGIEGRQWSIMASLLTVSSCSWRGGGSEGEGRG